MKNILYVFMVMATITIYSCANSSTKNSSDDSLTEFQRANLDTMDVESVVAEETEYVDTAKLFAEEEARGTRDIYAQYTLTDPLNHDAIITLKTDNTVVFESHIGTPVSYYGTWSKGDPDGISLEFHPRRCPIVGSEQCIISQIRDNFFYPDFRDALSKNPDMRVEVKKVQ